MEADLEILRQEMRTRFAELDGRIDTLWKYTTRQLDEVHRDTTRRFDKFWRDTRSQVEASRTWSHEDLSALDVKIEVVRRDSLSAIAESRRAVLDEFRLFTERNRPPA